MIRYVPKLEQLGRLAPRLIAASDLAHIPGLLTLNYTFPYHDQVVLTGGSHLLFPPPAGSQEFIRISSGGLVSRQPMTPAANAQVQAIFTPLVSGFRAAAGRFALLFWDFVSPDWRAEFTPLLSLRMEWGPDHRGPVNVGLQRHRLALGDIERLEWRRWKLGAGRISGQLDPLGSFNNAERSTFSQMVHDQDIEHEVSRLFSIGDQAIARMQHG